MSVVDTKSQLWWDENGHYHRKSSTIAVRHDVDGNYHFWGRTRFRYISVSKYLIPEKMVKKEKVTIKNRNFKNSNDHYDTVCQELNKISYIEKPRHKI